MDKTESTVRDIDGIKKRQTEFTSILQEIRDVYMGLYTPLDQLIVGRRRLDILSVESVAAELMLYTDCDDEMKDFYLELYTSAILYLYAEGFRPTDMILLSIWKIAATFHLDSTRRYFDKTPFGIMLSDLFEKPEGKCLCKAQDGRSVVAVLKEHVDKLKEVYDKLKWRFSADSITRNAIEIFATMHGWSCLDNPVAFEKARSNLMSSRLDAQYEMRKERGQL